MFFFFRFEYDMFYVLYPFVTYFRVRVNLRLAVYRHSIRLGDKLLETHDQ
jgi:hypothetical protein